MSTRAGVVKYLVSHGISPKGVVIQRGKHNYAGPVPGCLSLRWTCTTAKHVVQLTMTTNQSANQFVCTPSTGGTANGPNTCIIVQSSSGSDNVAACVEKI